MFRLQKRCIRKIMNKPPRFTCRSLFKEVSVLPLSCVYLLEVASHALKNRDHFLTGHYVHRYSTRHRDFLRMDTHRTAALESSPSYIGRKVFNKLPYSLRSLQELKTFRKCLKAWLMTHCYYSVQEFLSHTLDVTNVIG